jgi:hypothetical protein
VLEVAAGVPATKQVSRQCCHLHDLHVVLQACSAAVCQRAGTSNSQLASESTQSTLHSTLADIVADVVRQTQATREMKCVRKALT